MDRCIQQDTHERHSFAKPAYFSVSRRPCLLFCDAIPHAFTWSHCTRGLTAHVLLRESRHVTGMWPSDFDKIIAQRAVTSTLLAVAGGCAIAAGRLSFCLGLNGPCLEIDVASSSALAACSLALAALRDNDCSPAIVSGTHLMFHPDTAATMRRIGLLKASGAVNLLRHRVYSLALNTLVLPVGRALLYLGPSGFWHRLW